MKDFVISSALTRLLANIFIFLSLCVALFIGAWQIIASMPINPLVYTVVSTGMAYSLMLLGVHTGITMPQQKEPGTGNVPGPLETSKTVGQST